MLGTFKEYIISLVYHLILNKNLPQLCSKRVVMATISQQSKRLAKVRIATAGATN